MPQGTALLPALLSGVLWGMVQAAWFVANAVLGEPITFPIIITCPDLIATICGMVFFKEITVSTLQPEQPVNFNQMPLNIRRTNG